MTSTETEVRYLSEADYPEWIAGVHRGFMRADLVTDEELDQAPRRMALRPDRTQGAFDGGRCVGTFRSIPLDVTVPGGATLPAAGASGVTVTATHRRQGLLSRMMANDLAAAREREEPVAILIAAEHRIYGRFGFGPSAWSTEWAVDVHRARTQTYRPAEHGRVDLVDGAEVRRLGPELHDRFRRLVPGAISRPDPWWRTYTGELRRPTGSWRTPFHAVHRDPDGRVDGLLGYTVDDVWEGTMPNNTLTVLNAQAVNPRAEAALWRYALSVDWITRLVTGLRAPDDVLPLLLGDPRAARITQHADYMWLRVLDVATTLRARSYATEGSLVLDLRDKAGFAQGTYRLDAATEPGASEVRTTTGSADLAMDVAELGRLYLGDESAVRLAALGLVDELSPGAAARADTLLRTSRRPWCPDNF